MGLAVAGFVVGQIASALLLVVVAAGNGHLHDLSKLLTLSAPPAWVVVTELAGLWVGFLGAVVLASRTSGTGSLRWDMGLEFRPVDFVVGPVVGLAGQLLLLPLLYLPLEPLIPNLSKKLGEPARHLTGGFPGADLAVIAVLTVVAVPIIEELLFRGLFLRGALRAFSGAGRRLGPALAIFVTGIAFALAHFEALQTLGLGVFGALLAYMAWRAGRLGPSILAHATFNLVAVLSVATIPFHL